MKFEQTWQARIFDPSGTQIYDFFPAEVPGNVQYDFAVKQGWNDIQFGNNVKKFEDYEDVYWEYRCKPEYHVADDE